MIDAAERPHITGLLDTTSALAQGQGHLMTTTPEVLFVCVHNAGRSQVAAAHLDHYADGRVHVRSAGSAPASEVSPAVVEVMAELGLDVSKEFPNRELTDPAGLPIDQVRPIRDDTAQRVRRLLEEVDADVLGLATLPCRERPDSTWRPRRSRERPPCPLVSADVEARCGSEVAAGPDLPTPGSSR